MAAALRPTVHYQGRRAGTQGGDVVVQGVKLLRYRHIRVVGPQWATEPSSRPFDAADLSRYSIEAEESLAIPPAGRRDLRFTGERRQRRQGAVEAIVAAAGNSRTTVVDQLAVRVISRVGPYDKSVPVTERIFDHVLVRGVFDGTQPSPALHPRVRRIRKPRGGVRTRDVIAEYPEIVGSQRRIAARPDRIQSELLPDIVGDRFGRGIDRPGVGARRPPLRGADVYVGVVGIRREYDIYKDPVTAGELRRGIQIAVDAVFGGRDEPVDIGRGDIRTERWMNSHGEHMQCLTVR